MCATGVLRERESTLPPPRSLQPHTTNSKYLILCNLCVDIKCIVVSDKIYVQPDKALVRPLYLVKFDQPKVKREKLMQLSFCAPAL